MTQTPTSQSVYAGVDRVVAIGDLHGNYAGLMRILRETGLIDGHGAWKARGTHLVQLGDVLGRGGEPGKIFSLLRRLEAEAPAFDSRVHLLLGNHEAMSISGLLMYNTLEEFRDLAEAEFLDADGGRAAHALDPKLGRRLDSLGAREFRTALSPQGKLGSWLLSHASAIAINGHLFVHGGLNREHGRMPLPALNARVRAELSDDGAAPDAAAAGPSALRRDGPQWNRDYALRPGPEREAELREVLEYHECIRMVVGHTPTSCIASGQAGRILPLYGDRLYCIDTGIGMAYGGRLSALRLDGGTPAPLHFG